MDLDAENSILRAVAEGGSMDYEIWPELLARLIPRLELIAQKDFPPPTSSHPSFPHPYSSLPQATLQADPPALLENPSSQTTSASSQSTDKENAPPIAYQPTTSSNTAPGALPPYIVSLLSSITQTLMAYFPQNPPHTIQRLCELILAPKTHYRTLPSYLHAVDRVVHVTSGANVYPLPAAVQDSKALPNGTNYGTDPISVTWGATTDTPPSLGSDESLGGALLTPIPWLRSQSQSIVGNGSGSGHVRKLGGEVKTESTETIDGPNGAGSIETVSISVNGIPSMTLSPVMNKDNTGGLRAEGGVTQGELLRQEQRAGVVPAIQLANGRGPGDADEIKIEDDEIPHARGPEEIGMEDMGPQAVGSVGMGMHGIDVEAAVGRRSEDHEVKGEDIPTPTTPKREAADDLEGGNKRTKDEALTDEDRMVIVDANGNLVGVAGTGGGGEKS